MAVAVAIVAFPVRALREHVGDIVSLLEAAMEPSYHLGLWFADELQALILDVLDIEQAAEWSMMLS